MMKAAAPSVGGERIAPMPNPAPSGASLTVAVRGGCGGVAISAGWMIGGLVRRRTAREEDGG